MNFFIFGLWPVTSQNFDKKIIGRVAEPAFHGSRGDL